MYSKEDEANRLPPSYEESGAQPSNTTTPQPTDARITIDQRNGPSPMFVTARASVYGPGPVELDCPHCQAHIVTHIDRVAGVLPWLVFGACVVLGFFLFLIPWCFCCLPFFVIQCLDVLHSCPVCKRHLGRYSRM